LPRGAFIAEVSSLRAVYAFTTRLFVSALVQHNSLDRKLVTNLRLGFIHRPGSDLFLVFNEDRGDGVTLRPVAHRGFAMKRPTWRGSRVRCDRSHSFLVTGVIRAPAAP
jgi:hypothetical protein